MRTTSMQKAKVSFGNFGDKDKCVAHLKKNVINGKIVTVKDIIADPDEKECMLKF